MSNLAINPNVPAGFVKRAGGDLLDAHNQWRSRPKDEAVFSVEELVRRCKLSADSSKVIEDVPWSSMKAIAKNGDLKLSRGDGAISFSNFSLQQFCRLPTNDGSLVRDPEFLTCLSAETAATVINERLQTGIDRKRQASLLVSTAGRPTLRRINTDKYEQVFDLAIAQKIEQLCSRGGWGAAQAFVRAGTSERARHADGSQPVLPLGWVGDRNMFVLLVDYSRPIKIGDQSYARFCMISHSEVGAGALNVTFGLLDFVCCNMILWGCTEVYEASFRHTRNIHEKWAELGKGLSKSLTAESEATIADGISAARKYLLADTRDEAIAVAIAATDLPKGLVVDAYERAEGTPRYGDPRSAWGMLNGLTEASQHAAEHADKRAAIDAKAARLMGLLKR